jgi:hypothetical protein
METYQMRRLEIKRLIDDAKMRFGEDLLAWMQKETEKHEHCCVTGDCPHESQGECYRKLVEDCIEETQRSAAQPNDQAQAQPPTAMSERNQKDR